jgi:hypothetical protein
MRDSFFTASILFLRRFFGTANDIRQPSECRIGLPENKSAEEAASREDAALIKS